MRKGVDIDITNFKCFTCKEQINSKILLFTKQYSKTNTLLFIDENFMYLSKDVIINKKNENIRRISEIYDLNQLFNYSVEKKKNGFEFALNFLLGKNFLDRQIKKLLFEEKEGEIFESFLLDTLDKIDSIYINEEEEEEEEEEDDDDIDENDELQGIIPRINDEALLILEKDLKIGFFYIQNIKAGDKFVFYEEINNSYGILDFCMTIQELDINLTITDLTEGRIIYHKKGLDQLIHCPLKLVMFFSNPRIIKFEFDNSYSWFSSKNVKYKTTILYPKNPYLIGHQILISKYQNTIIKANKRKEEKNKKGKNKKKDKEKDEKKKNDDNKVIDIENILITRIDGENKVFNCINVKENLVQINKMVKDKYLYISSIFIEIKIEKENDKNINKSLFYYINDKEGLIQNELTKENFEKYLLNLISKSKANLHLFNLYIINGDKNEPENNNINNTKFYYYSMKKLLGFEPIIKIEGMMKKIIFFIQYLNQAQILYYLYKQIIIHQKYDIVLLINYTKYCGYQYALYYDEEIFVDLNEFKGLSKDKSIEENIEIIVKGVNKIIEEEKEKNKTIKKWKN